MTNRTLWPLALAASLLCPLAVQAQTPTTPTPPAAPAAPTTPPAPPAPKKHTHVHGPVTAVDMTAKTVTVTTKHGSVTLTLTSSATVYKPGDLKGAPTGTLADIRVGSSINAHIMGDDAAPTTNEIHLLGPHKPKSDAPATLATPAAPATPAVPATP